MKRKHTSFEDRLPQLMASLSDDPSTLIILYDSYRAIEAALNGIYNQPRIGEDAHTALDREIERATDLCCAVAEKLRLVCSIPENLRGQYVETIVSHALFVGDHHRPENILAAISAAYAVPSIREKLAA